MSPSLLLAFGIEKIAIKIGIRCCQCFNSAFALCSRCASDFLIACSEPFLLLELFLFPWRIARQYIKPTRPASLLILRFLVLGGHPEHIGEGQVPVEELVLGGQALDFGFAPGGEREGVSADVAELFVGDGRAQL